MKKENKFIYLIIGILIVIISYELIPFVFKYIVFKFISNPSTNLRSFLSLVLEIIIFSFLFVLFHKTIINDFKKFKKDSRKNLDIGFKNYALGFVIMAASNIILSIIFGGLATNESLNRSYLKAFPIYSIIEMILIGPMMEELIFRLGFRKGFKSWLPYALFSAFVFGGLHVYSAYANMNSISEILKNWHQVLYIVPYGALGFAFAKTYYETDNIWTTITIHTLHNAFTIFMIFMMVR